MPVAEFDRRRDQGFWRGLREAVPALDALIGEFNAKAGLGEDC